MERGHISLLIIIPPSGLGLRQESQNFLEKCASLHRFRVTGIIVVSLPQGWGEAPPRSGKNVPKVAFLQSWDCNADFEKIFINSMILVISIDS
jgi:hypothetical protein